MPRTDKPRKPGHQPDTVKTAPPKRHTQGEAVKRALTTALAFITLMAGAICAPSAVAAGSITAKLIYILEKDGTAYEAISLSSTDGTINDSNCDDIDRTCIRFYYLID